MNRGGQAMKISSVMSRDVQLIKPDDTIRSAAALMKKIDAGLLPVTENDKLVGMITDRDIAIRGVAEGKGPDAKVRDAMSPEVKYCFEDEDVTHVAENMAELQVRRLPVMNRDKRLVGIFSLADLAIEGSLPKQQRRFTAFRNRVANTTRVGRVLDNHMVSRERAGRGAEKQGAEMRGHVYPRP